MRARNSATASRCSAIVSPSSNDTTLPFLGPGVEHGQLPEMLARPEHAQRRDVAQAGGDANREVTLDDQVQRVAGITVVEHHLVALEHPPPRGLQHRVSLGLVEHVEQP